MGVGDSQLIPSLGMSHLTPLPVPYFHGMLKPSDLQRAVGFQGGPEGPHWLHVCSGKVGKVICKEKELGSPWGKRRKLPARLWTPKWSCRPPSRAMNQHGQKPHYPPEKAATATRWQAEPSIPAQVTVPGRKTQSWLNNPLLPCTSRSVPLPCISIWRTFHGATSSHHGAQSLGIQKTFEFQVFRTNSEEELPGSHPHQGQGPLSTFFGRQRGLPQLPSALWCLLPATDHFDFRTTGAESVVPGTFIQAR